MKWREYKMDISALEKIDYKSVLKYFLEISSVPRGSGHNEKINQYLVDFAKKKGFEYYTDEALNVVITKPAAKGYEDHEGIIIQGHMDMVCVCEAGIQHDFENEPLEVYVSEENGKKYLRAKGTTLGADDGVAVAIGLAMLDDADLKAPMIELFVTTDEETSMVGANNFDYSVLKSNRVLNLDSENEGIVIAGCAGGITVAGNVEIKRNSISGTAINIQISGLLGGHSGEMIGEYRTNANVLMGRILMELFEEIDFNLISINGGEKNNAIPDACKAVIIVKHAKNSGKVNGVDANVSSALSKLSKIVSAVKKELTDSEPGIKITAAADESGNGLPLPAFDETTTANVLNMLTFAPDGVQVMSHVTKNFVESSLNLGILKTYSQNPQTDTVYFEYLIRSSKTSYMQYVAKKLLNLFMNTKGSFAEILSSYEPWEYNEKSELREIYEKAYEEQCGKKPVTQIIHAGLECSIFAKKMPGADLISIGPDNYDIHTPNEHVDIDSFIRSAKLVELMLEKM